MNGIEVNFATRLTALSVGIARWNAGADFFLEFDGLAWFLFSPWKSIKSKEQTYQSFSFVIQGLRPVQAHKNRFFGLEGCAGAYCRFALLLLLYDRSATTATPARKNGARRGPRGLRQRGVHFLFLGAV